MSMAGTTTLEDVQDQAQQFWSPRFAKELRETTLLPSLVNREYTGDLQNLGDTVRVSQIVSPDGELLTISKDANLHEAGRFRPEPLRTIKVDVPANYRAVASFEIEDLVDLQTQIGAQKSEMMDSMKFTIERILNRTLYGLVAPSSSNPDHITNSAATMSAAVLAAERVKAGNAKWDKLKPWFSLMTPGYWGDFIQDTKLANADYHADNVIIGANGFRQRMGFLCAEDNSMPSNTPAGFALQFHPDFLYLVMQQEPRVLISSTHSNGKFGYIISVDMVFGAILGIQGALKHTTVSSAA